jgi:signal transduction histidine kinase
LARLRSNFVAGVSHELRTPLAQIRMFSETLLLNRVRNDSEKQRALEIISQESTRLSQLVDNVLYVHRKPRASDVREHGVIDLIAFVREVVESFEPLAASKRVRLAVAHGDDEVFVRGDAGALRQVLLNLLDNAVKFGPAGQLVTIDLRSQAEAVLLSVEDEGPGVPETERQRIFKAFERGRRTNGSGGAGIGLAVVQQIVRAHRGEITVANRDLRGARFTVALPLAGHAG